MVKKSKKTVLIVGGGTAGLTIANRLQNNFEVIIIEKNKYKKYPIWYKIPLLIGLLFKESNQYISKREHILANGRRLPFFESNMIGGASVINGCVHVLGNKRIWTQVLKKFRASYSDLLLSLENIYSFNIKDKYKINLSRAYNSKIDSDFLKTLNIKGISSGNVCHSDGENSGPIYNTIRKYFRTSVLTLIKEKKFKIYMNENIKELLFENKRVIGVRTSNRKIYSDYTIISSGVVGTCKLLLENKKFNRTNDYILFQNVIGKGIKDHTNLRINVLTKKNIGSLNEISDSFFKKTILLFKHFFRIPSLMRGTGATTAAHLDLDKDGLVDTRIQIVQFRETGRAGSDGKLFSDSKPGFSISITQINPKSSGFIELDGERIKVNPNYLSSKEDIDLLKKALSFCIKILRSKPLSDNISQIEKEDQILNDPKKYIFENVYSGYHLIGGCQNLINSNFQVKNTENLYICDASIFGQYASSNIHSSVVLISDIFAKKFITNNFEK